jgi:hypothetical protein
MKKSYLFILVTFWMLFLSACSNDLDSGKPISNLTMKVGGVVKNFNNITVKEVPYADYSDLIVTARNNENPTEFVTFGLGKGDVGPSNSWGFEYTLNGVFYSEDQGINGVNSNLTTNESNKLIGTFSGAVTSSENIILELSQGAFNITY